MNRPHPQPRLVPTVPADAAELLSRARGIIAEEAEGMAALSAALDDSLSEAVALIVDRTQKPAGGGRLIVTGVGKSGHIGAKLASTFASTGTPSFYLHAAEASHGDLGMVMPGDIVLAISNSGDT